MPTKETEIWPIITEEVPTRGKDQKARKFTIKDARNTWEIENVNEKLKKFTLKGFSNFYFILNNDSLNCFKQTIDRVSDSGQLSCFDDRYNLVDDEGKRKTLRLKNFKLYIKEIFN